VGAVPAPSASINRPRGAPALRKLFPEELGSNHAPAKEDSPHQTRPYPRVRRTSPLARADIIESASCSATKPKAMFSAPRDAWSTRNTHRQECGVAEIVSASARNPTAKKGGRISNPLRPLAAPAAWIGQETKGASVGGGRSSPAPRRRKGPTRITKVVGDRKEERFCGFRREMEGRGKNDLPRPRSFSSLLGVRAFYIALSPRAEFQKRSALASRSAATKPDFADGMLIPMLLLGKTFWFFPGFFYYKAAMLSPSKARDRNTNHGRAHQ